mmetsp:Transcript_112334/g.223224  ORF Transcript_112334/g.223224 Transcript_112334/m.223224 type:complete len:229 (-) Transcript_112334:910-1596(-)
MAEPAHPVRKLHLRHRLHGAGIQGHKRGLVGEAARPHCKEEALIFPIATGNEDTFRDVGARLVEETHLACAHIVLAKCPAAIVVAVVLPLHTIVNAVGQTIVCRVHLREVDGGWTISNEAFCDSSAAQLDGIAPNTLEVAARVPNGLVAQRCQRDRRIVGRERLLRICGSVPDDVRGILPAVDDVHVVHLPREGHLLNFARSQRHNIDRCILAVVLQRMHEVLALDQA